jgi:phage-related protein
MRWTVETLHHTVDADMSMLPIDLRARMIRIMEMVENVGLDQLREPHVKHIEGKLWELRVKSSEGIARGRYCTVTGRRVILLHVLVKKSDKMPRAALEIARNRMERMNR